LKFMVSHIQKGLSYAANGKERKASPQITGMWRKKGEGRNPGTEKGACLEKVRRDLFGGR